MIFRKLMASLALVALAGSAVAAQWEVDSNHSTIGFSVKHMMVSTVHGSFGSYTAKVDFDPAKPDKMIAEATIEAASINTNNQKRDDHLRTADFFEVDKYPQIVFKAKRVHSMGEGRYHVLGDLTMHGVTKEIMLEGEGFVAQYKNPWGQTVTAVSARGTINREDFGITWNTALETGGVLVSKEVVLELDLELIRK